MVPSTNSEFKVFYHILSSKTSSVFYGVTFFSDAELPPKAKVVICGGGATGAAVAYKLAQRGLGPETVMIDKGEVGGGTTVHASGLVGLLKQSKVR